ncbi:MAG: hypothetical protein ACRD2G_04755, partial [Terriglobia bacterium]
MEGKFSTEGLQSVAGDDDLLMAMARELVTEQGIGESAEVAWRHVQQQNETFGHRDAALAEPARDPLLPAEDEISWPAQRSPGPIADQLLLFGASLAAASGRKGTRRARPVAIPPAAKQLGLF